MGKSHTVRFSLQFALLTVLSFSPKLHSQNLAHAPTEGTVSVNGAQLYYEIYGKGEPIVILHGGPGLDHTYLLPQMLRLADHYKLIFYDQRGSGRSTGTVDSTSITVDNFVNDLEQVRKALHLEQITLLGHSWGGLLAMEYAFRFPNRVRRMILASSVGSTSEWEIPFDRNRAARRTSQDSASLVKIMASDAFAKRAPPTMEDFARTFFRSYFYNQSLADRLSLTFSTETAHSVLTILALMGKQIARYDIRDQLAKLTCPVLILHGDADPIPLQSAEEIHTAFKNSKLIILKNSGHFPYIEAPEQFFTACEEFLRNTQK
jgi:proline iminopeptidase